MRAVLSARFLQAWPNLPGDRVQTVCALIAAALAPEESRLRNLPEDDDVMSLLHALRLMGCKVSDGHGSANFFRPVKREADRVVGVPCEGNMNLIKLLMPVALACGRNMRYDYCGEPELPEDFLQALRMGGAKLFVRKGRVYARKGMAPMLYDLQMIQDDVLLCGMLLAMPLLGAGASMQMPRHAADSGWINQTISVMREFGVHVMQVDTLFCVTGEYHAADICIEGDWRLGAFWLAAGVINGVVRLDGMRAISAQPQSMFYSVLKEMNASVQAKEPPRPAVRSTSGGMIGGPVDLSRAVELFPLLAATACFAKGSTIIKALPNTHGYAAAMHEVIKALGGSSIETEMGLMVRGIGLHGRCDEDAIVNSSADPAIALAIVAAAGGRPGRVVLNGAECLTNTYPNFFSEYKKAGGSVLLLDDEDELPPHKETVVEQSG